jgi:hypothetical protein
VESVALGSSWLIEALMLLKWKWSEHETHFALR